MHFYYFLYIFTSDFADFAVFFSVFRVVRCISLSLLRASNPHMPTVGSGALLAILTDCQQLKTQKNTQMMIMIDPADGDEPPQGRTGRGMLDVRMSDGGKRTEHQLPCCTR